MLKLKHQYFGHLMGRDNLLGKTDAGKDWRPKEKGVAEDEVASNMNGLNGDEFEQTQGDSEAWSTAVHGVTNLDMN